MGIPKRRCASNMDIKKSMLMGLDECHIALKEAYADLDDSAFQVFAIEGHNNIASIVTHLLQQHDHFNAALQRKRGIAAKHEWRFMQHEERFELWGLPKEKLPKPGESFPTIAETLANHELIHKALIDNITAISEKEFISSGVGQWPRLCDMFFRAIYHANAHIRQIWYLRGVMGIDKAWPVQHYA